MNANREQVIQTLIDHIMDSFDVKRCLDTMKHLEWGWGQPDGSTEIPDEYEFRNQLRISLKEAARTGGYASAGFMFTFHDSVDQETGEPFVMFRGGFYVESLVTVDGMSYSK